MQNKSLPIPCAPFASSPAISPPGILHAFAGSWLWAGLHWSLGLLFAPSSSEEPVTGFVRWRPAVGLGGTGQQAAF